MNDPQTTSVALTTPIAGASNVGLQLPETLTYDEWAAIGDVIERAHGLVQWYLGDWILFGKRRYGERYQEALAKTHYEYQTLRVCVWVARSFELLRRRNNLGWAHHREVAALPPGIQDECLQLAEVGEWSVHVLREYVRSLSLPPPAPPLTDLDRFPVLCADPPWRYDFSRSDSRQIENQYPTMELDELTGLAPDIPAADDAVLFLWTTSPKLSDSLLVMEAWGFEYRTCLVWVKDRLGMGYYARQQHELLLVGRRGDFAVPEPARRPPSVVNAPRAEHSVKPSVFYALIEQMYPGERYVELFAREQRPGWAVWGNEVERA